MYIQIKCMYIISLPPIRKTKDNHKMRRIKSIEPILCNITMYESSCSIIQVEYHTRKQSSSYAVMHHERKSTEQLRHSTKGRSMLVTTSQQVKMTIINMPLHS